MIALSAALWGIYWAVVVIVAKLAYRDWRAAKTVEDMKVLMVTTLIFVVVLAAVGTGLAFWPGFAWSNWS